MGEVASGIHTAHDLLTSKTSSYISSEKGDDWSSCHFHMSCFTARFFFISPFPVISQIISHFPLMLSCPLIKGRDYFTSPTGGLIMCTPLCFPVGGMLDMNSITLRVTPRTPGHALACLCVPWTLCALCKSQVMRSKQSEGYSLHLELLIKAKCVLLYHMIGICVSVLPQCIIAKFLTTLRTHLSLQNHSVSILQLYTMNKRMLINDLISAMVPHHTSEETFWDGRPGGTCGFPPCLELSEGQKHQSIRARLLSRPQRGAVADIGGSGWSDLRGLCSSSISTTHSSSSTGACMCWCVCVNCYTHTLVLFRVGYL